MLFLLQILGKPHKYIDAVKIQNMFNRTNSSNKFKIEAGVREGDREKFEEYKINKTPEDIIKDYNLGKVAEYKRYLNLLDLSFLTSLIYLGLFI